MKKSELKLSQLPDKYESDRKFCGARSDDDFSVALYTWTDEDEKKSNFDCYDNEVIEIASVALVDDCLKMHWCKVETEIVTDILKDIDDDMNCRPIEKVNAPLSNFFAGKLHKLCIYFFKTFLNQPYKRF